MTLEERIKRLPRVFGHYSGPIGRRKLGQIVVPVCPTCKKTHVHKAQGPYGGLRVGSCGTAYVIKVAGTKRARLAAVAGGGQ